MRRTLVFAVLVYGLCQEAVCSAANPVAVRFPQNPLITLQTSKTLGDDINGPALIRVPEWVKQRLGRYYLYFAHHKGTYIRMAYADSLHGPWKIYEPGVLHVRDSVFYRPQPDPPNSPALLYTHVASPDVYVDEAQKRIVMYFHGIFTDGKVWPTDLAQAAAWMKSGGYQQFTQAAVSNDGIHFQTRPGITKVPYLRVFRRGETYYAMAREGVLARSADLLAPFEIGPNPFDGTSYAGRVRHAALLVRGNTCYVFFSAIGDAPECILMSRILLTGDWKTWRASTSVEILRPDMEYECSNLPSVPSEIGEIEGPARQLRDPAVFEENGKVFLFYSVCGEQGIAAAEINPSLLQ